MCIRDSAYDVKKVIDCVVDWDSFFEVQEQFAKNVVVGFARMEGNTVGIVANQPMVMGGSLDYHASDKAARFIRFCDCFNTVSYTHLGHALFEACTL